MLPAKITVDYFPDRQVGDVAELERRTPFLAEVTSVFANDTAEARALTCV
jgi:hypothetical protein